MAADGDQCAWLLRILVICLVPILYGPLLGNPLMPIHEERVSDTQIAGEMKSQDVTSGVAFLKRSWQSFSAQEK